MMNKFFYSIVFLLPFPLFSSNAPLASPPTEYIAGANANYKISSTKWSLNSVIQYLNFGPKSEWLTPEVSFNTWAKSTTQYGDGKTFAYYHLATFSYHSALCVAPEIIHPTNGVCYIPLENYDGDPDACHSAGGWVYGNDYKCVTEQDFKDRIEQLQDGFIVGTGLKIGGALMTAAGLIGLPFTLGASAGLIATGVHAYAAGSLYLGFNDVANYSDSAGSMGSAISAGGKTYKLDISNYQPSDPTAPSGKIVTVNDDAKKRVTEGVYVPENVINQMSDASQVNTVTDKRDTPIDLTGTIKSTYDYNTNTVTTQTQISPTQIKTQVSPFSVSQTPDGAIIAKPVASSMAPTVSGSSGGSVVEPESAFMQSIQKNYRETQKYWDEIAAGYWPTNDLNVTAPVDDTVQTNADILSKLDEIKQAITSGNAPQLDDHSSEFAALDANLKSSYSGFIYVDPLGINSLGGGSIPTFSFTLYGRTFIILSQSMLDSMPLDAIRSLLLFIAAISAFITVISGV